MLIILFITLVKILRLVKYLMCQNVKRVASIIKNSENLDQQQVKSENRQNHFFFLVK